MALDQIIRVSAGPDGRPQVVWNAVGHMYEVVTRDTVRAFTVTTSDKDRRQWVTDNPHLALEYLILTLAAREHGLTIADNLRWQYGISDDYCLNPGARRAEGLMPDKSLVDMLCMLD